jgi:hypothetical protein
MSTEDVIDIWNEYIQDAGHGEISSNDEAFFVDMFISPYDAVLAAAYGDWNVNDDYVCLDDHENLQSFSHWQDDNSPVDADILADWLTDNPEKLDEYDIE